MRTADSAGGRYVRVTEGVAYVVQFGTRFQQSAGELPAQVVEVEIFDAGVRTGGAPSRLHRVDPAADLVAKTNASGPRASPAGSVRSISRTAASRCPIGITRVELVFVLCARKIMRRYLPVESASTSRHCSFRSSPIRQAVDSVAMINARRWGPPQRRASLLPFVAGALYERSRPTHSNERRLHRVASQVCRLGRLQQLPT